MGTVLSLLVLSVIGLVAGAIAVWRRAGLNKQVLLLLGLAAVAMINIAIWTIPDASGEAPIGREPVQ